VFGVAKIMVLVCDECEGQTDVKRFELKEGSRKATMDLCGSHREWAEGWLDRAAKVAQRPRAGRSRAPRVTSMEEIEAKKK
jgi:hypothetical protein